MIEAEARVQALSEAPKAAEVKNLSFWYGDKQVLEDITLPIYRNQVTALIGPSGCGKSTLLRSFNRMHDLYHNWRAEGEIQLLPDAINIMSKDIEAMSIRLRVGMVFQKPNPFPQSIFDNIAYGLRIRGIKRQSVLEDKVEWALESAGLLGEVKDRLHRSALSLSGGQQQRVCIARAIATNPEILLLDEPTSALDPISSAHIEELITQLRSQVTVLIVTHNLHQAARVSDHTAFMYLGKLVEFGPTNDIFTKPKVKQTENYITGRFG